MKRQRVEKPMGDEELREMERRDERERRESKKEDKMTWTSVGEEIMT